MPTPTRSLCCRSATRLKTGAAWSVQYKCHRPHGRKILYQEVLPENYKISIFLQLKGSAGEPCVTFFGGSQKGGFQKGGFGGCSPGTKTGTRVRSPKPPFWKPPFYLPMTLFGVDKKGGFQKGGFGGCSPGTKTGTRVRSPKPPFYETALLSPSEFFIFGHTQTHSQ